MSSRTLLARLYSPQEKYSFFERVQNPDLAREITVMPIEQVGVDAAILFSDILVIAKVLDFRWSWFQERVLNYKRLRPKQGGSLNVENTEEFFATLPSYQGGKEGLYNRVPLIDLPALLGRSLLYGAGRDPKILAKQKIHL